MLFEPPVRSSGMARIEEAASKLRQENESDEAHRQFVLLAAAPSLTHGVNG